MRGSWTAIRSHQKPSEAIRSHQKPSETSRSALTQRRDHGDARLVDGAVHAIIHVLRRVLEVASQCGACRLRVHLRLEQRMPVAVGARRARGELGAVGGRAAATTALDDVKQLAYDEVGVVPVDDCRYDGELAEDAQHVLHLVGVLAVEERLVVVEVALVACEPAKAAGAAEMTA